MIKFVIVFFISLLALFVFYAASPRVMMPSSYIHTYDVAETKSVFSNTLRLMTYNIGFGGGLENEEGRAESKELIEKNLSDIVRLVNEENPDVLCVQEIDIYSRRSHGIDQVEYLAKACNFPYIATAITWNKKWVPHPLGLNFKKQFGFVFAAQVVFSKYPIESQAVIKLEKPSSNPFWYNWFYLDRLLQTVTIKIADKLFNVGNIHLEAFDQEARIQQVNYLLNHAYISSSSLDVLVGDFNTIHKEWTNQTSFPNEPKISFDHDESIQAILAKSGLIEVFQVNRTNANLKDFFTFPSNNPNRQLDYVFYNQNKVELKNAQVITESLASDHFPINVDLAL